MLVTGLFHGLQRPPLSEIFVVQPQLLTHHQLLPHHAAQRHDVGGVRAYPRPLRLQAWLHEWHHLVVAGLQQQVGAGRLRTHHGASFPLILLGDLKQLAARHQWEADVAYQSVDRGAAVGIVVVQPLSGDVVEFHLGETLQGVAGQSAAQGGCRELQVSAAVHQRGQVIDHKLHCVMTKISFRATTSEATALFSLLMVTYVEQNILQMQVRSDAFHLHTVVNSDLGERKKKW